MHTGLMYGLYLQLTPFFTSWTHKCTWSSLVSAIPPTLLDTSSQGSWLTELWHGINLTPDSFWLMYPKTYNQSFPSLLLNSGPKCYQQQNGFWFFQRKTVNSEIFKTLYRLLGSGSTSKLLMLFPILTESSHNSFSAHFWSQNSVSSPHLSLIILWNKAQISPALTYTPKTKLAIRCVPVLAFWWPVYK